MISTFIVGLFINAEFFSQVIEHRLVLEMELVVLETEIEMG